MILLNTLLDYQQARDAARLWRAAAVSAFLTNGALLFVLATVADRCP